MSGCRDNLRSGPIVLIEPDRKLLSGLALMQLHHDFDIDIDEICTIFVTKHKRRMSQGCILYE